MLNKYQDEPLYEIKFSVNLVVRIDQSVRVSRQDIQLVLWNTLSVIALALIQLLAQYFGLPFH